MVMIATYDMDHKTIAGITMQKLINASKRGVKVYLIIDDLNFYVDQERVNELHAAGGICIRNNPFARWHRHVFRSKGRISKFFQRNHQKVKLVDDTQFVGSLNVADSYSGVRYGDGSFRDLNAVAEGYSTKGARDFFRDMLLRNAKHYRNILDD
jgi:phosphatidylserine/phosphatidylglycerophosphate/cardiolipin synthase-like enzyme